MVSSLARDPNSLHLIFPIYGEKIKNEKHLLLSTPGGITGSNGIKSMKMLRTVLPTVNIVINVLCSLCLQNVHSPPLSPGYNLPQELTKDFSKLPDFTITVCVPMRKAGESHHSLFTS